MFICSRELSLNLITTIREKAEKEAAEKAKQVAEESDDGVVVSKV